jgi:glutamine amidotransferase-like uncharacterized protein
LPSTRIRSLLLKPTIEEILRTSQLNYSTINSLQLNEMGELQMRGYRLLIAPGGNFINMGNSLTPGKAANIRFAVQNGLSYAGICAGGFLGWEFHLL